MPTQKPSPSKSPSELMVYLTTAADTSRKKTMLDFALAHGLEREISLPTKDQMMKSGVDLAAMTYVRAANLANCFAPSADMESIFVISVLLALQETNPSTWSYGAELLYQLRAAGISISREEVGAFLAQEGTFASNRTKGSLMETSLLAPLLYCGFYQARLCGGRFKLEAAEGEAPFGVQFPQEPMEAIVKTIQGYASPYVGEANQERVSSFLAFLQQSSFSHDPASTKYHLSQPGGLALHTATVLRAMVSVFSQSVTASQMGKISLAAICHDLCKVGVYQPTTRRQKVDGEWVDVQSYAFQDPMPFGHGRKSMYMAAGFFGAALGQDVAKAIDGHMADDPNADQAFVDFPLGVGLHVADMIATYILEK